MTRTRGFTVADLTPAERDRIALAIHVSGHAIAGTLLGGELSRAVVGRSRVTGLQGLTSFDDLAEWRWAAVAYAGPWAQARWNAGRRPTLADLYSTLHAAGCAARDSDAAVLNRNGGTAAGAEVVPLLQRAWPAVTRLAAQLYRTGEVFPSDVVAALRLSRDAATRAIELSMIRSGAAPGSFTSRASSPSALTGRANPRSHRTRPSPSKRMFAGLRSRWAHWHEWIAAKASTSWRRNRMPASGSLKRPLRMAASSDPS
jgi:hypothetical protein